MQSTSICTFCNADFVPKKGSAGKFCSKSCAASYNNQGRLKSSKTRFKLAQQATKHINIPLNKTEDDYQIKFCRHCSHNVLKTGRKYYCSRQCVIDAKLAKRKPQICTICKNEFISSRSIHVCPSHEHMFLLAKRSPYEFKFNVFNYPQLFDLDALKSVGFKNRLNPDGIVRDHKISIYDAIKYGYDPYYISHVMNCQLLSSRENLAKNKRSSLNYEELKKLVDHWDEQQDQERLG